MQPDILLFLAESSITLFGFVSIFFIFRYQRIDTYIDNRKPALRLMLQKRIERDASILMRIETIGHNERDDDISYFSALAKDAEPVLFFVREVRKLHHWRAAIKRYGMLTILYLAVLSGVMAATWLAIQLFEIGGVLRVGLVVGGFALFVVGLILTFLFLYRSFGQHFLRH
ncbi:MAG: hypothetical protein H7A21_09525 [Spirochaetales bacterium]|nr:hypothetical protein [Leptospiraceae bacterium]MCP5481661.1 hypothetical protein [Spirochaetales bacterium]